MKRVQADPAGALRRRLWAGLSFLVGEDWLKNGELARKDKIQEKEAPSWLMEAYPAILTGTLLGMLLLGTIGWRWTYAWRREAMPSSLAIVWVPVPYLLTHAEAFSGPRLPIDGILLTYAAFALTCLIPGVGGRLLRGAKQEKQPDPPEQRPTSIPVTQPRPAWAQR